MNISKSLFKKVAIFCIKKSKFGTLRSSPPEVFCKKVLLEMLQNSQENTCATVSFSIKLQAVKKRLWHRCFPVNFAKFLRTPFVTESLWWLLLYSVV